MVAFQISGDPHPSRILSAPCPTCEVFRRSASFREWTGTYAAYCGLEQWSYQLHQANPAVGSLGLSLSTAPPHADSETTGSPHPCSVANHPRPRAPDTCRLYMVSVDDSSLTAQVRWLGTRVSSRLALSYIHQMNHINTWRNDVLQKTLSSSSSSLSSTNFMATQVSNKTSGPQDRTLSNSLTTVDGKCIAVCRSQNRSAIKTDSASPKWSLQDKRGSRLATCT